MRLTEEDLDIEWEVWGHTKPWWCPLCRAFLASDFYEKCDGTDPTIPRSKWKKHELFVATPPLSKEEFGLHLLEQHDQASFEIDDLEVVDPENE